MHTLLARQLKKCGLSADAATGPVREFLRVVESAYAQYDDDRRMLERSLELSSRELLGANADMRALLQSLPDLFLRLDAEDVITDRRGAACSDYFPGRDQIQGCRLADLVPPDVAERLVNVVSAVRADGQQRTAEYALSGPVGEEHYEARFMRVVEGEVIALLRNITPIKTFEAAILRERAFLRQVIDLDPNFVFAKDRDGRFTLANQAVADAYGTTVESLLGRGDADFNPNEAEVRHFLEQDRAVMDDGIERRIPEERITDASGRVRWLQTVKRPIQDPDGQRRQVLGVATDITQLRATLDAREKRTAQIVRQQAALQELAASGGADPTTTIGHACSVAAQTLDAARASVWLFDEGRTAVHCAWLLADGSLTAEPGIVLPRANYPRYFAAIDNKPTVAATDALHDARTSEFADGYLRPLGIGAMLDCAIRVGGQTVGVLCLEHVGGAREWSLEEQDFASAVASFVALARALEQQRGLEAQLRHSQKMEAVGMLAGGIAHDFNNLLTAILGFAELLRAHARFDPVASGHVSEIVMAGQRAAALTSQLLAFGRKQPRAPQLVGINGLVTDLSRMLERVVGESITLCIHPASHELLVRADPNQIEQVLLNLVVNARDAMAEKGGAVRVRVKRQVGSEDAAGAREWAVLEVEDTGVGIAPEDLPRVFEPFFTTKGVGAGTGLGLAMVYGLVQQNGGTVELASQQGVGTIARVMLPIEVGAMPSAPTTPDLTEAGRPLEGGPETVLIVEDEAVVRLLAVELLTRLGYRVLVAARPSEALEVLGSAEIHLDLLVTDLVMPEMNGAELYQAAALHRPGLRVMYMSGYAPDTVLRETALKPGTFFLAKPFTLKQLADRVREALQSEAPVPAAR